MPMAILEVQLWSASSRYTSVFKTYESIENCNENVYQYSIWAIDYTKLYHKNYDKWHNR